MFGASFVKTLQREDLSAHATGLENNLGNGRHRCFLPVLDMANGKDHPTRKHHTSRDSETGSTMTRAIWSVPEGEQVFENYATPNYQNLLYHGFILDKNSFDSVDLYMRPARNVLSERKFLLPALQRFKLSPISDRGIILDDWQHVFFPSKRRRRVKIVNIYESRLSVENERRALSMIITECDHVLKTKYVTSGIEEDEALLSSSSLSPNQRTSISFRLQQKRIFDHVKQSAQSLLDDLGGDSGSGGDGEL